MNLRIRLRLLLSPIAWRLLPNLYLHEEEVRRILLVKTGSLYHAMAALDALEKRFPIANIAVLTEEREFNELQQDSRVTDLIFYRNIWQFPSILWQMRRANYDVKVVLFTKEATYEKFKVLSILLHARKMLVYNEHGDSLYWGVRDLPGVWYMTMAGVFPGTISRTLRRLALLATSAGLWPFILIYLMLWTAIVLVRYRRDSLGHQ
ncbi:MAG: hypothetical protein HYY30_12865 [Chloroflexi bacterium]|nr:hypothetical protein [Chloroflexota bacterium]